jgi:hypothetical protein
MIQEGTELDRLKAENSKSSIAIKTAVEALTQVDGVAAKDLGWISDKDAESLKHLPWPEENESKE